MKRMTSFLIPFHLSHSSGGSVGGDPSAAPVGSSVLGVSPATQKLWDSPSAGGGGAEGGGGGPSAGGEGKSPAASAAPLFLGTNQWGPSTVSRSNDDATWGPQPPPLNTSGTSQGQRTDHSVSQPIPLMGGRSTHHSGSLFKC